MVLLVWWKSALTPRPNPEWQERPLKFAAPPQVKGASFGGVIWNFHVWPIFRPIRSLGQVFKQLKDRATIDRRQRMVYRMPELPWLCIHLRRITRALVELVCSRTWFRLRKQQRIRMPSPLITNIHPRGAQILEHSVTSHNKKLCSKSWHSNFGQRRRQREENGPSRLITYRWLYLVK